MERRIPKEDIHKIKWTDLGNHAYHHWLHERGFAPEFDELCYKSADIILDKLKEYNVNSIVKMASSYKFCVIATGEYDIYAARERANEWDYAAGHAVAQNAGAIIKTLDEKPFLYGKEDYRNPSLLIRRAEHLDV